MMQNSKGTASVLIEINYDPNAQSETIMEDWNCGKKWRVKTTQTSPQLIQNQAAKILQPDDPFCISDTGLLNFRNLAYACVNYWY